MGEVIGLGTAHIPSVKVSADMPEQAGEDARDAGKRTCSQTISTGSLSADLKKPFGKRQH